jgi:PadR family transcriptional regulator PadR
MESTTSQAEWKRGSAELLILSLVEARPRHGYEISKLIEQRSGGTVRFHVASLYPMLYRLERRGCRAAGLKKADSAVVVIIV